MKKSVPLYAFGTTAILLIAGVVLILFAPPESQQVAILVGLIVTTIPSIVAAAFSERASRDIRNGVVEEKAKEGATQALLDNQILTRTGPVVTTQLVALARLLEQNTKVTTENTEATKEAMKDG